MGKYYVKVVGRAFGPIESRQIQQMIADGKLTEESEISANKLDWSPLGETREFKSAFASALPESSVDSVGAAISNEKKEWYYSVDGQTGYGPYCVSEILALIERGQANFDTLVWRRGENSRAIRSEPEFMNAFDAARGNAPAPTTVGAPRVVGSSIPDALSPRVAERLSRGLRNARLGALVGYLVSVAFALIAGIIYAIIQTIDASQVQTLVLSIVFLASLFVAVPACFYSYVEALVFVYRFWASIPRRFSKTTPGAAAGLLIVPFFVFYWRFVAFRDGARAVDGAIADYVARGLNQNEEPTYCGDGAALAYAVVGCVSVVLAFIAPFYPLFFYFCTKGMRNAAIQLNSWRAGTPTMFSARRNEPRVTLDDIMNS